MGPRTSNGAGDQTSVTDVLRACPICRELEEELLLQIGQRSVLRRAHPRECLWHAQSAVDRLVFIQTGLIRMTRSAPRGGDVVVEILGPGDCTGIFAALGQPVYPLTAWAVAETVFLEVRSRIWNETVATSPQLRDALLHHMAPRLLQAYDFLATMLCGTVEQRMAHVLVRVGSPAALTHVEWANLAHTTVESAIRTTTRWQKLGWISKGYKHVEVAHWEPLHELACPARSSSA